MLVRHSLHWCMAALYFILVLFGDEIEKSEFYSNPATYKNIEGIRYLEVSHYMQKMANINNIDWNEYWPELESITLLEY